MKTTRIGDLAPEVESEHKTVAMTIDNNGVEHLMSTLTNLYADAPKAVLREYSANALDSHVKSGQTKPVEITISEKFLQIRDFGVGLTSDELEHVYSKYGSSTKRDNNKEIGGFGLGAKSALAIADEFNVTAVHGGIKTKVLIKKNARGVGIFHFLSEEPTQEANGVTVHIPLNGNGWYLEKISKYFFTTWPAGSVSVNGVIPASIHDGSFLHVFSFNKPIGWVKIETKNDRQEKNMRHDKLADFNIGGVLYPIASLYSIFSLYSLDISKKTKEKELAEQLETITDLASHSMGLIIDIPIGSIDLTPSREQFIASDKTLNTLNTTLKVFLENLPDAVKVYANHLGRHDVMSFLGCNWYCLNENDSTQIVNGPTGYGYGNAKRIEPVPGSYSKDIRWRSETIPAQFDFKAKFPKDKLWFTAAFTGSSVGPAEEVTTLNPISAAAGHSRRESWSSNFPFANFLITLTPEESHKENIEATLKRVERNIKDYTSLKCEHEATYYISTVRIDDPWVQIGYTYITLDELIEGAKQARKAKRTKPVAARAPITYISYDAQNSKMVKAVAGNLPLAKDIIYVPEEEIPNLISSIGTYDIWRAVKNPDETLAPDAVNFLSYFSNETHLEAKTLVFVPKSRSLQKFLKDFPGASNLKDVIAKETNILLAEVEEDKLASIYFAALSHKVQRIAKDLLGATDYLDQIKSGYSRSVFEGIQANSRIHSFFATTRVTTTMTELEEIKVLEKYRGDNRVDFDSRYSMLDTRFHLDSNEDYSRQQAVFFINAIDSFHAKS